MTKLTLPAGSVEDLGGGVVRVTLPGATAAVAAEVTYDPAPVGDILTATNVQDAIDEILQLPGPAAPDLTGVLAAGNDTGNVPIVAKDGEIIRALVTVDPAGKATLQVNDAAGVMAARVRIDAADGGSFIYTNADGSVGIGVLATGAIDINNGTAKFRISAEGAVEITNDGVSGSIAIDAAGLIALNGALAVDSAGAVTINSAPVGTRAAAVADAVDEADAVIQLNALLAAMRASNELAT